MTLARARVFANKAWHYLANARKLAREPGGEEKAGEILWGAAVLALKAVALVEGRKVGKYSENSKYVSDLDDRYPGVGIFSTFKELKSLHGQFYELEVTREEIEKSLDHASSWMSFLFEHAGLV